MLLREMFSPIGAPKEDNQDIDWLDDLHFFISNDDKMLSNYFFPAVDKHKKYQGHPLAYKLYLKSVEKSCDEYCSKFKIDDKENKFPHEKLIDLAKRFANEQEKFLSKGDYETT